jgi:hypothetical protein
LSLDTDIAWSAGLFEGEGCIGTYEKKDIDNFTYKLVMSTTDLDVLERFQSIVGGHITRKDHLQREWYKQSWDWSAGGMEHSRLIMCYLFPYLGERRQAKWADVLELKMQWKERRLCM